MSFSYYLRMAAAAYVIQVYGMNTTMSVGPSMLPTFNVRGDILLSEYVSPRLGRIRQGDVVVAVKPTDPHVSVVKRVKGISGDVITVTRKRTGMTEEEFQVPEGFVWLEGDNKAQSTDSREYGPVPYALVKGRVVARCWPLSQAKWL